MNVSKICASAVLVLSALLSGCATKPPSLYQWERYQANIDAHFRADKVSPDVQAQLMEADLQKIKAVGGVVPPGFQAHLGLLYGQMGRLDLFVQMLQAEKTQFLESETFMNFLMRNFKK